MDDLISRHGISAWLDNMGYSKLADVVMDEDRFPSAQPETHDKRTESHACDLIDRQPSYSCSHEDDTICRRAAVDAMFAKMPGLTFGDVLQILHELPSAQPECDKEFVMLKVIDLNGRPYYSIIYLEDGREYEGYSSYDLMVISEYLKRYFGFAQPEHLTDDDFETIRIHLSAFKEGLCNQGRWKEAEEYERLINRFMSFASAQPEIIRCRDCIYWHDITPANLKGYQYCHAFRDMMPKDGYCHKAQRREVSK